MWAWLVLIVLVLAALIVVVNSGKSKQGEEERMSNFWGLYDLRRPNSDEQNKME